MSSQLDETLVQRYAEYITGHPGAKPNAQHLAATRAVMNGMMRDGWIHVDLSEPHLISFDADGFTIQHPLRCRPNLFTCRVNAATVEDIPRDGSLGIYECNTDDSGNLKVLRKRETTV